eukprot:8398535-Pyramimonas_sp.AAC.1
MILAESARILTQRRVPQDSGSIRIPQGPGLTTLSPEPRAAGSRLWAQGRAQGQELIAQGPGRRVQNSGPRAQGS